MRGSEIAYCICHNLALKTQRFAMKSPSSINSSQKSTGKACLGFVLLCMLLPVPLVHAQKVPRLDQYKRMHQDALKKIVDGEPRKAKEDLSAILEQLPEDAESHYMLAVAHAKLGEKAAAIASVEKAIEAGLPVSRFLTGTKTGLEPIQDEPAFKKLRGMPHDALAHGPMLGCVTGSSVRIWVRTAGVQSVIAKISNANGVVESKTVLTTVDSDHTAVLEINGLTANTEYSYSVGTAAASGADLVWHNGGKFKTLEDKGTPIKFRLAFGGGAGFVPQHEYMWDTIRAEKPDVLFLLGDNVYSDAPKMPEMQHYCYYRRQSRPEFKQLIGNTPTYTIWDDHDFGTNDCSGGPAINEPKWKLPVYRVFRNNWVNPGYGGGDAQPGCYYDFYLGDIHFVMLDGRYYRDLDDKQMPTMLGPVQREWLLEKIKASTGKLLVLCSPVPWVFEAKGDSKDTWNGFKEERKVIFDLLSERKKDGVLLMSADRHRSDLWKIERPDGYPLYEFNSSRLTNQHVHKEMPAAVFSYNKKQSFGTIDFDTTLDDPTITYRVISIDGEEVHRHTLRRSQLKH